MGTRSGGVENGGTEAEPDALAAKDTTVDVRIRSLYLFSLLTAACSACQQSSEPEPTVSSLTMQVAA